MSITCKAKNGLKIAFSMYAKTEGTSGSKIRDALKGKIINSIVVDEVFLYNIKMIDIADYDKI